MPNVISNKTDHVYSVHLPFPCCLEPPEELSQNYLTNRKHSLCCAPLRQKFPTQQHLAPYPLPTSIINLSSFIGTLSRPFINLLDYLTGFCTLSQNSSTLCYKPSSKRHISRGGLLVPGTSHYLGQSYSAL